MRLVTRLKENMSPSNYLKEFEDCELAFLISNVHVLSVLLSSLRQLGYDIYQYYGSNMSDDELAKDMFDYNKYVVLNFSLYYSSKSFIYCMMTAKDTCKSCTVINCMIRNMKFLSIDLDLAYSFRLCKEDKEIEVNKKI